jgi:hypothetical protein
MTPIKNRTQQWSYKPTACLFQNIQYEKPSRNDEYKRSRKRQQRNIAHLFEMKTAVNLTRRMPAQPTLRSVIFTRLTRHRIFIQGRVQMLKNSPAVASTPRPSLTNVSPTRYDWRNILRRSITTGGERSDVATRTTNIQAATRTIRVQCQVQLTTRRDVKRHP